MKNQDKKNSQKPGSNNVTKPDVPAKDDKQSTQNQTPSKSSRQGAK
jgi:hypothetical protein